MLGALLMIGFLVCFTMVGVIDLIGWWMDYLYGLRLWGISLFAAFACYVWFLWLVYLGVSGSLICWLGITHFGLVFDSFVG